MTETSGTGRGYARHLVGLGITVLCLVVFFQQISVADLLDALATFQWVYLLPGVVFLAMGYALRIQRWNILLRASGASTRFASCGGPFLASIALNNLLPLRLGDIVRALVFPRTIGVSRATSTSSLIAERLIDLITLLICLAIGLLAIQSSQLPEPLVTTAITLVFGAGLALLASLLLSARLSRYFRALSVSGTQGAAGMSRVFHTLADLLHGLHQMLHLRLLLPLLVLSGLVWLGEAGLFFFVMQGVDAVGSPLVALLVMAVATLSTLVPSSPGYVGPFHIAAFTAISLAGAEPAQAGSYAVIVHMALWIPTTLAGAAAIWLRPELYRSARMAADRGEQDKMAGNHE